MQLFLVGSLLVAILIALPIIGGATSTSQEPRVTVIHKNQTSPTLGELGRKSGDPAQAGVPNSRRQLGSRRMEQWI